MARKKRTTQEFIEEASRVHDGYYDYSLVEYNASNKKIKIICAEHGVFLQQAGEHLKGSGCYSCGIERQRLSQNDFIERCRSAHHDKYDYSLVNYVNMSTKIKIVCPEHGEFLQLAGSHVSGNGCPNCRYSHRKRRASRYCTQDFVNMSMAKHGNKYDYSKSVYVSTKTMLTVTCPSHGDFIIRPIHHYKLGQGCDRCFRESRSTRVSEFIEKANAIHNGFYDYSLLSDMEYIIKRKKIPIICPIHGVFYQSCSDHTTKRSGCRKCADGYKDYYQRKWADYCDYKGRTPLLYIVNLFNEEESFYKIGITMCSIQRRMSSPDIHYSYKIHDVYTGGSHDVHGAEYYIKRNSAMCKYSPNQSFAGDSECHSYVPSDLIDHVVSAFNLIKYNAE